MRYRKLDASGDMTFGGGVSAFYVDSPDAVAQAIGTRLRLQVGDWYLDTSDGTDWRAKVLGAHTANSRDMIIRERIIGTPGVSALDAYSSTYNGDTRQWSVAATVDTEYGAAAVVESL